MLLAAVDEAGAVGLDCGIVGDTVEAAEAALDRALASGAHVLLTSGGVSMGERDVIKPLLARRGSVHFGRVKMKPGKPLTFATVPTGVACGGVAPRPLLVFGLPGNPVSR